MKEKRRPISGVKYAVAMPHDGVAYVYESSHKYLQDPRFQAFPEECQIFSDWENAWDEVESILHAKDPHLYYGVKLKELTLVFAASTDKQKIQQLDFDVEDDWNGCFRHHADKLLRVKMQKLGIMDVLVND